MSALIYPDLPQMAVWLSWAPSVAWVYFCTHEIRGTTLPYRSLSILGAWSVILLGIGRWMLRQQRR
ncbi:MAG: hypothetical protein C7B46_20135 [Sulfobacillus benefaciens]|uniref:Uncharacterized protein n=1 Tax=Sulfobacillus benefaciens TaxID=453960 RepID=A0A2T2WVG8_9FIRM|nr:MAG: hypothetical protein C7B46_20135 [Sulfobacillus benefaciens]